MRSPEGEEKEIVAAGVGALLALGWTRAEKKTDSAPRKATALKRSTKPSVESKN